MPTPRDTPRWAVILTNRGHAGRLQSPDAAGSRSNGRSGRMRLLQGHSKDVRAVAYAPDGRLVSGGDDRTARVWDAIAGTCLHVLKAPNVVYAVATSPDGTAAIAGRAARRASGSNAIHLWNLDTGRQEGR